MHTDAGTRRLGRRHTVVAALALAAAACAVPSDAGAWTVGVAGSLAKFRADAAPPPLPASASLSAARNEFESFQIVVTGPATGVRATASALSGPGGTIPSSKVWLYREDLLTIPVPGGDLSSATPDDVAGRWPDALVPAVDEIYGEPRNAFPFDVASGETRAIWVDVFVPPGTPAGDYSGSVAVTFAEAGTVTVPVSLHVWNFDLPSTASARSLFGFSYGAIPNAHGVGWPFTEIRHAYGVLALDHRISLGQIDDGDDSPGHVDAAYGDLLRGTAGTRLAGAKLTSLQAVLASGFTYADWWTYFSSRGFGPTLVAYVCDEPPITPWSTCHANAVAAHNASPQFRTLVTTSIQNAQSNVGNGGFQLSDVNLIDPEINALPDPTAPLAYQSFLASNPINELWDYESCDTHGCSGRLSVPWPVYAVDSDPVRNRALEWLSFQYGVQGELYFDTVYMLTQGNPGPWSTLWAFTGNGDGTLFYPGVPSTAGRTVQSATPSIGGTHDIPVASMRLKLIREGLEDYEYLKLDAALGGDAVGFARAIFPNSTTVPTNVALMSQREAIARDIELRNGTAAPAVSVSASPSSLSTAAGGADASTITVSALGGYAGTVSLAATGVPSGASASFAPASLALSSSTPSGTSTLSLGAGSAPAGTYAVTVTATDAAGSPSGSTTVAWTIAPPPPVPQLLFADDFDRTTGLGASWRVASGSFTTDGSQAVSGAFKGSKGDWALVAASIPTSDYSVEATLAVPAGSLGAGVVARSSGRGSDAYSARISTDGTVSLQRRNAWSWTRLGGAGAGIAAGTPYAVKLLARGSSPVHLEVWLDGARLISYDDASPSRIAGGVPGIESRDPGVRYDRFAVWSAP